MSSHRDFPIAVLILRCCGAFSALFWSPPIADINKKSDTVLLTRVDLQQGHDHVINSKEVFETDKLVIRRLNKEEKYANAKKGSEKIQLRQENKWTQRFNFGFGFIIILTSFFILVLAWSSDEQSERIDINLYL